MKRAVNALQNFGKSLYGPVLILPIVGLFIAFGNVLGNGSLAEYIHVLGYPAVQNLGQLIAKSAVSQRSPWDRYPSGRSSERS